MSNGFLRGAAAGAAGTTALNAVTYADMAVRGRASSSTPQDLVEAMADRLDIGVPGRGEQRDNRLAGLGPLSGTAVGVLVGAASGLVHEALHRRRITIPAPLAAVAIGAAAMALSDVPLKVLGISDPSSWSRTDWLSDAVPHLVYGWVTHAALSAGDAR